MFVVPRRKLPALLKTGGLEPQSRDFPEAPEVFRLTIREKNPQPFLSGPHRKVTYPDGRVEGPFPVADRPALSRFIASVFLSLAAEDVLATIPEGAFWLNNRAQSAYLHQVPDAEKVSLFLRRRGLTDRFQGGFQVQASQLGTVLPSLAANTYAGGTDVLFSVLRPSSLRLTALSCHHFDIHFSSPTESVIAAIAEMAEPEGLEAVQLSLPDLPDMTEMWFSA